MPQSWETLPVVDPGTLLGGPPAGPGQVAAPAAPRGQAPAAGNVSLRPPPQRNPEALMTMEEKIAEGIPADMRHLPYRWDANRKPVLPEGVAPPKDAAGGKGSMSQQQLEAAQQIVKETGLDLVNGVDPVSKLIEESTSGGIQKWAAEKYGDVTGEATSGMEKIGRLEAIGSNMTLLMTGGSLGAQISNADREFINKRMGDIANPATPANKRLAAWDEVKNRLAHTLGVTRREGGELTEAPAPAEGEEAAPGRAVRISDPDADKPELSLSFDPQGNVIHKGVEGGGSAVASDTGFIGGEGGTHTEADPRLKGTNATLRTMIMRHEPTEDIVAYLKGKGMKPDSIGFVTSMIRDIRQWEDKNNTKWDGAVDLERMDVPNTPLENVIGSDVGAGAAGYMDALTAFTLDNAAALAGKNPEEIRAAFDASRAAHPKATTAGNVLGAVTAATGGTAAAGRAGLSKAPAILAGDIGYSAAAGAGATDVNPETGEAATAWDRAKGAATAGAMGAVASGAGVATGAGMKALGAPSPDKFARTLNEEGVPTTLGSQYGGRFKKAEDWLSGQTGGGIIAERQAEAYQRVNERVFDRVLKPIGEKNAKGRVGNEAVEYAQKKVSQQYQKALGGKTTQLDPTFAVDFSNAFQATADLPTVGPEVAKRIQAIVTPHLQGGQLTGEGMQALNEQLRAIKSSYRGTPMAYEIGQAIDDVSESVFGLFRRQAPDVIPAYNKAQVAYKRLAIASDAVLSAEKQGGVFTPAQLRAADRAASKRSGGKVSAAANKGKGKRQFGKLSAAAQEKLPKKIPDSGTARLILPALLLGTGGATTVGGEAIESEGMSNLGKAATLAGILTLAYTKGGQRILTKPGRGITNPKAARAFKKVGEKGQAPAAHVLTGETAAARENKKRRLQREKEEKARKAGKRR